LDGLLLTIGNKNYSSWSLRPWILMKHLGLEFVERVLPLDTPEFSRDVGTVSPTRRVPVLEHGDLLIWDSLAICEYACELAGGGWPRQRQTPTRLSRVGVVLTENGLGRRSDLTSETWTAQVLLTGEQQGLGLGMKSTQAKGSAQPPISLRVSPGSQTHRVRW